MMGLKHAMLAMLLLSALGCDKPTYESEIYLRQLTASPLGIVAEVEHAERDDEPDRVVLSRSMSIRYLVIEEGSWLVAGEDGSSPFYITGK